jgi:hypothetical protein
MSDPSRYQRSLIGVHYLQSCCDEVVGSVCLEPSSFLRVRKSRSFDSESRVQNALV